VNGTTLERPDVAAYVDAVRSRLADLPAEERDDLVADVEASLLESGETPKLPPQEFAAELREAAGLDPAAPASVEGSPLDSLRAWVSSERVASWRATAGELAPIWWLARAYVAVVLLAVASNQGWPIGADQQYNEVSLEMSVFALLIAAGFSIWLGLRGRREARSHRRLAVAANAVLALALLPVAAFSLAQLDYGHLGSSAVYVEPVPGLVLDGAPIRNMYPYTRDGTPLFDVLLYDETGRPLDVLTGPDDMSRRILDTVNGTQLFNSFPIRYFEAGTTTVARPELAPPITVPKLVTPPLEVGLR